MLDYFLILLKNIVEHKDYLRILSRNWTIVDPHCLKAELRQWRRVEIDRWWVSPLFISLHRF